MAFHKINIHKGNLETAKETFKKKQPIESKKVFDFLRLLSIGQINKGKTVGEGRQNKYLTVLPIFMNYFKKPITKITKKDMELFIQDLKNNKIKRIDGGPYSSATKEDVLVMMRIYLKWRLPKKYTELTDWIDYHRDRKTVEYLKEEETEKLYDACKNNSERFLISVLFDAGCRAEEFLNIRFEDIEEPTESFPYYKIDFKEEYSKTKGRIIGMYWKHSTKVIKDYLNEVDKKNSSDPVFPQTYDNVRFFLTRLGKRVLNKRLHFHLLRKSSATYYAPKLNRQELCYRYGWVFSSDVCDVYISRNGEFENGVKDKLLNGDINKLEKKNQDLETKYGLIVEKLNKFEDMFSKVPKEELKNIFKK